MASGSTSVDPSESDPLVAPSSSEGDRVILPPGRRPLVRVSGGEEVQAQRSRSFHIGRGLLLLALGATSAAWLGCAAAPQPWTRELQPPRDDVWFQGGRAALLRARARLPEAGKARNVIVFVGDGMGVSTVTAARILEGQRRGEPGEEGWLAFERLPHTALIKTYNTNQQVPDSAGTMTAIMSGVKTKAGVIGVDDHVRPRDYASVAESRIPTLLEQAEFQGLSTGVVSTARITHATPAACYGHAAHRDWESDRDLPAEARAAEFPDLARQMIEMRIGDGLEVALGGGRRAFLPQEAPDPEYADQNGRRRDGADLTRRFAELHPDGAYVWNLQQLRALDLSQTGHLLGLFEPSHMHWEADRDKDPAGEPSLTEMTLAALEILERNPRGYFLMVEAGRIDHGHHASNAYRALTDTLELGRAVEAAVERVDLEETLVLVTADHGHVFSHGGYSTRGNPILGLVRGNDEEGRPKREPARDLLGLPYTSLGYTNGPGYSGATPRQGEGAKRFPSFPLEIQPIAHGRPDLAAIATEGPLYLQESAIPLTAETHSGEDVPAYAGGPGSVLVHGVHEQSYLYHVMLEALGWTDSLEGREADPRSPVEGSAP